MRTQKFVKTHLCVTGKIQHKTPNGAVAHSIRLANSKAFRGEPRGIYQCPVCSQWHVGGQRSNYQTSLTA
jgi:hypothetical protein